MERGVVSSDTNVIHSWNLAICISSLWGLARQRVTKVLDTPGYSIVMSLLSGSWNRREWEELRSRKWGESLLSRGKGEILSGTNHITTNIVPKLNILSFAFNRRFFFVYEHCILNELKWYGKYARMLKEWVTSFSDYRGLAWNFAQEMNTFPASGWKQPLLRGVM